MAAIFGGAGLGLFNGSVNQLNGFGSVGRSQVGQGTDKAYVNIVNGSLVIQNRDEYVAAQGLDLEMLRTYNSQVVTGFTDGDNNDRWQMSVRRWLKLPTNPDDVLTTHADIQRSTGDGFVQTFKYDSSKNAWISSEGSNAHDILTYNAGPPKTWTLTIGGESRSEIYDHSTGRLVSEADSDGNTRTFEYKTDGRLWKATDASGQVAELFYDATNTQQITEIRYTELKPEATSVTDYRTVVRTRYKYDQTTGRLTDVLVELDTPFNTGIDGHAYLTHYDYTGARITSIKQSDATVDTGTGAINQTQLMSQVDFSYLDFGDGVMRVWKMKEWYAGSSYRETAFNYDYNNRRTDVTLDGQLTSYYYDTSGRITSVALPDIGGSRTTTQYTYDTEGNVSSVIDGAGNWRKFAYSNGNLTWTWDKARNATFKEYNAFNKLSKETAFTGILDFAALNGATIGNWTPPASGTGGLTGGRVTQFVYDTEQHLRFVITPEGGVTRHVYDNSVTQTSKPGYLTTTARYEETYSGNLAQADSALIADLDAWCVDTARKRTSRVDYKYDLTGQLRLMSRYEGLNASGGGTSATQADTYFIYDAAGVLLTQIDALGGSPTYAILNDPNQANTDGEISTNRPSGGTAHVTTYAYDGLLRIKTSRPADGANNFNRATTFTWSTTTNTSGGITMTATAPDGVVTTTMYDRSGNVVSIEKKQGSAPLGTTLYRYDASGRLQMTVGALGERRLFLYDARGWKVGEIDAEGALTEYVYSDAGVITQEIRYDRRITYSTLYDASGDPKPVTLAGLKGTTEANGSPYSAPYRSSVEGEESVEGLDEGEETGTPVYGGEPTKDPLPTYDDVPFDPSVVASGLEQTRFEVQRLIQQLSDWRLEPAGVSTLQERSVQLTRILSEIRVLVRGADSSLAEFRDLMLEDEVLLSSAETADIVDELDDVAAGADMVDGSVVIVPGATLPSDAALSILTTRLQNLAQAAADARDATIAVAEPESKGTSGLEGGVKTSSVGVPADPTLAAQVNAKSTGNRTITRVYDQALRLRYELTSRSAVLNTSVSPSALERTWSLVEYQYDGRGLVTQKIEYAGSVSELNSYTLDSVEAAAAEMPDHDDRITRYYYDKDARQVGMLVVSDRVLDGGAWRNSKGYITKSFYDGAGRLTFTRAYAAEVTIAAGADETKLTTFSVNNSDSENRSTYNIYDAKDQLTGQIDAAGYLTAWGYDKAGNRISQKRFDMPVTIPSPYQNQAVETYMAGIADDTVIQASFWEYDELNRVVKQYDQWGSVTPTVSADEYDKDTTPEQAKNVLVTTYAYYEDSGFLKTVTRAAGQKDFYDSTKLDERKTSYTYDGLGRVLTIKDAENNVTTHYYDQSGRLVQTKDALGHYTLYYYDSESRLRYTVKEGATGTQTGEVTETRYTAFGNVAYTIAYAKRVAMAIILDNGGTVRSGLLTDSANSGFFSAVNLASFTGAAGNRVNGATYTLRGEVDVITDAAGNTVDRDYDAFGALTKTFTKLDATRFRTDVWTYNQRGLLTQSRQDKFGINRTWNALSYDAFGAITSEQTSFDLLTTSSPPHTDTKYDNLGRIKWVRQPGEPTGSGIPTRQLTYDAFSRMVSSIDATGIETRYEYTNNADDRMMTLTIGSGSDAMVTRTIYNRFEQTFEVEVNVGNSEVTKYKYDHNGRLTDVIKPTETEAGTHEKRIYDAVGNLDYSFDSNGVKTDYGYDAANRVLTRTVDPAGLALVTSYEYDAFGGTAKVIDPKGTITETVFDEEGRPALVIVDTAGLRLATRYEYDAEGHTTRAEEGGVATWNASTSMWSVTTAALKVTDYTYTKLGQLATETTHPGDGVADIVTKYFYDEVGHLVRKRDGADGDWRYFYDVDGQQIFAVDPLGGTVEAMYDRAGRITGHTRYATVATLKDVNGNLLVQDGEPSETFRTRVPLSSLDATDHCVYDAFGRKSSEIDALGAVTRYVYDRAGRVGETIEYTKAIGTPTAWTDAGITTALTSAYVGWPQGTDPNTATDTRHTFITYDTSGRAAFTVNALRYVTEQVYDANGNVVRIIQYAKPYAASNTISTDDLTDARNLTGSNTLGGSDKRITDYVYDAANRLRFTIDPMGAISETRYDAAGRVSGTIRYAHAITQVVNATDPLQTTSTVESSVFAAYDNVSAASVRSAFSPTNNFFTKVTESDSANLISVQANKLEFKSAYSATPVVSEVRGPMDSAIADRPVFFKTDVEVGTGTGRFIDIFLTNNLSGADARRHGIRIINNDLRLLWIEPGSGTQTTQSFGTVMDGATYQLEIEVRKDASLLFFYRKGESRSSGYSSRIDGSWTQAQFLLSAKKDTNLSTNTINLDNLAFGLAEDQVTVNRYDGAGRLTSVTDAEGFSEYYGYDAAGNRTSLINKLGKTWTYAYDGAGRLTDETTPPVSLTTTVDVTVSGIGGATQSINTADGQFVYVAGKSDGGIALFKRSPGGTLTFVSSYTGSGGYAGLAGVSSIATSGNFIFAISSTGNSIAVYEINTDETDSIDDGALTFRHLLTDGVGGVNGLSNPQRVIVAPDGVHVLVVSSGADNAIALFTINPDPNAHGELTYRGMQQPGGSGTAVGDVVVAPTGPTGLKSVYVVHAGSGALVAYTLDGTAHTLSSGSPTGVTGASSVAISSDGEMLFVGSTSGNTVRVYRRDTTTGALTLQTTIDPNTVFNAQVEGNFAAYAQAMTGVNALAVSRDGKFLFAGSATERTLAVYNISSYHFVTAIQSLVDESEAPSFGSLTDISTSVDGQNLYVSASSGEIVTLRRDLDGRFVAQQTLRNGQVFTKATTSSQAITTHYAYDGQGRVTSKTDAYGLLPRETEYAYDLAGRQTRVLQGSNIAVYAGSDANYLDAGTQNQDVYTDTWYDAMGNAVANRDANGRFSYKIYDLTGRLKQEIDAERYLTTYDYDAFGNVIATTRFGAAKILDDIAAPNDALVGYEATARTADANDGGARTAVLNAVSRVRTLAGQLVSGSSGRRAITTTYDALNRKSTVLRPAADYYLSASSKSSSGSDLVNPLTRYTYDAFGELIQTDDLRDAKAATQGFLSQYFAYDKLGRKTQELDAAGYLTTTEYGVLGRVTSRTEYANKPTLPAGQSFSFGVMSVVTTNATASIEGSDSAGYDRKHTFTYDRLDRQLSDTRINAKYAQFSDEAQTSIGVVVQDLTTRTEYDAVGNVSRSIDELGGMTQYDYDALGQMTAKADPTRTEPAATAVKGIYTAGFGTPYWRLSGFPAETRSVAIKYRPLGSTSESAWVPVTLTTSSVDPYLPTASFTAPAAGDWEIVFTALDYQNRPLNIHDGGLLNPDVMTATMTVPSTVTIGTQLKFASTDQVTTTPLTTYGYDALGKAIVETRSARGSSAASPFQALAASEDDQITYHHFNLLGWEDWTTDAEGNRTQRSFDAMGHVAKSWQVVTDVLGTSHQSAELYKYDRVGQQTETWKVNRQSVSGRAVTELTGGSNPPTLDKEQARYNGYGEVIARGLNVSNVNNAATYQESAEYDALGRLWRTTQGGVATVYRYDLQGNATIEMQLEGTQPQSGAQSPIWTPRTSDASAYAAYTQTAAKKIITENQYDELGRLVKQIQPGFLNVTYEASQQDVTITPIITRSYDRWGNLLATSDPRDNGTTTRSTEYRYNDRDQQILTILPSTHVISATGADTPARAETMTLIDAMGRQIGVRTGRKEGDLDTTGNTTRNVYDAGGNLIKESNAFYDAANGGYTNTTVHVFDALGREIHRLDGVGARIDYRYDHLDRELGHTIVGKGGADSPDGFKLVSRQSYRYDETGNRVAVIDGTGNGTLYRYDTRGRLVQLLTALARGDASSVYSTYFEYDAQDRKIRETSGKQHAEGSIYSQVQVNDTQTWTYDYFGRTTARTGLSGSVHQYTYDGFGRLTQEVVPEPTYVTGYSGQLTMRDGNNVLVPTQGGATTYAYYANGWVSDITQSDGTKQNTSHYTYDALGNHLQETTQGVRYPHDQNQPSLDEYLARTDSAWIVEPRTISNLAYDDAGRLSQVEHPSAEQRLSYEYDLSGNRRHVRLTHTRLGATWADNWYTYDAADREIVSEGLLVGGSIQAGQVLNGKYQGSLYSYDAAGNRISEFSKQDDGDSQYRYYDYDAARNLGTAWKGDAGRTNLTLINGYIYDAAGRAVRITSENLEDTRTRFYNANGWLIKDAVGSNTIDGSNDHDQHGTIYYRDDVNPGVNGSPVRVGNTRFDAGTYDAEGNATYYRAHISDDDGRYRSYYLRGDTSYLLGSTDSWRDDDSVEPTGGGDTNAIISYYDAFDQVVRKEDTAADDGNDFYDFTFGGDGHVTNAWARFEGDSAQNNNSVVYWYANGQSLATVDLAHSKFDIDLRGAVVTDTFSGNGAGNYLVLTGDTLQGIAQKVYGDSTLWYLIADANGIESGDALAVDTMLDIPVVAKDTFNKSDTFEPYNPAKIIGNTTPELPPPPHPKGCGALATVIIIAVAVAATIVTGGAAAAALGAAEGVVATIGGSAVAGAAAVGAAGAAAGSIASQLAGMAMGMQDSFSFNAVAKSALVGGLTAGIAAKIPGLSATAEGTAIKPTDAWGSHLNGGAAAAARAVTSNVVNQGVQLALGQQHGFSWTSVAASAVTGGTVGRVGNGVDYLLQTNPNQGGFASNFFSRMADGFISQTTTIVLKQHGKIDFAAIAADAFGNAIGNSIVGHMQAVEEERVLRPSGRRPELGAPSARVSEDELLGQYHGAGVDELGGMMPEFEIALPQAEFAAFEGTGSVFAGGDYMIADIGKPRPLSNSPAKPSYEHVGFAREITEAEALNFFNESGDERARAAFAAAVAGGVTADDAFDLAFGPPAAPISPIPRPVTAGPSTTPDLVISGYDSDRYNKHDAAILAATSRINADKAGTLGATAEQAASVGDVDPRLVKSWMIQESGGNDARSKAAWDVDPLQANVPGDWDENKSSLGLVEPKVRNEGSPETNIFAGIVMMIRKGFGRSAQPPMNRPEATFDGYYDAVRRYNGRNTMTTNGLQYSQNYAQQIFNRANDTSSTVYPIELPKPK